MFAIRFPVGWLIVLALVMPARAVGCRCAPQPLAAYLAAADHVFVARVEAAKTIPDPSERVLTLAPEGPAYKGRPDRVREFRTGASTASCGVLVPPGATLVVFAQVDPTRPGLAYVHTCNGTRELDPGDGLGDFEDVPAAQVRDALRRLTGRAGAADAAAPERPGAPIGLASIPVLMDPAFRGRGPVPAFSGPGRPCGRRLLLRGDELVTRETGYDLPVAVVQDIRDGWYRLTLADPASGGEAWISPSWVDRYWPLAATGDEWPP